MAVQYQVRSQVVDLRADRPQPSDRFYVDTNVWFWVAYPNHFTLPPARATDYGNYLRSVLQSCGHLHWCGLQFAELAHIIEETEFAAYKISGAQPAFAKIKDFRHGQPSERARVAATIETAWRSIEGMANPLPSPIVIDQAAVDAALRAFPKLPLDGYDFFPLKALHETKVLQVISDDGDFCTVPGIVLFTANRNVISAAQSAGLLVVR